MPNDNSSTSRDNASGRSDPDDIVAQTQSTASSSDVTGSPSSYAKEPEMPTPPASTNSPIQDTDIYVEVINRISEAKNVLIALSSDPSVDEMAAAIGLSIYLDKLGKRATAIYSGTTPNALEFLKPEQTFEPTADTLQDFVIALSKEKADHLRYKLDGSYVKIYITPYRSRISEEDLDFSYGDYNVDLVLALDVVNGIDLDSALREHGRIMHDAVIINITTSNPGKFGEIEWSDKKASSVSEMIARLLYSIDSEIKVGKEEATAFLTGIVAATNRFSGANTTPETMRISSLLMDSGANQQLVSKNITPDAGNERTDLSSRQKDDHRSVDFGKKHKEDRRGTDLSIGHNSSLDYDREPIITQLDDKESHKPIDGDNGLLNDLKVAAESLSHTGAETTPETAEVPFRINSNDVETPARAEAELRSSPVEEKRASSPLPNFPMDKRLSSQPDKQSNDQSDGQPTNPAVANVPDVPTQPDTNGIPDINYTSISEDGILPPPPAPPVTASVQDMPPLDIISHPTAPTATSGPTVSNATNSVTTPASSTASNVDLGTLPSVSVGPSSVPTGATPSPLGSQPAMQDQVYVPPASDPSAFKIPGA